MKEGEICQDNGSTESGIMNMTNHPIEVSGPLPIVDRRGDIPMKKSTLIVNALIRNGQWNEGTENLQEGRTVKETDIQDTQRIIHQSALRETLDLRQSMADMTVSECRREVHGPQGQERPRNKGSRCRRQRSLRIARFFSSCITCSFTH